MQRDCIVSPESQNNNNEIQSLNRKRQSLYTEEDVFLQIYFE